MANEYVELPADTNQARGIAQYAIDFLSGKFADADRSVYDRVEQFHLDPRGRFALYSGDQETPELD